MFQNIAADIFIATQITHLQWVRVSSSWLLSCFEVTGALFDGVFALSQMTPEFRGLKAQPFYCSLFHSSGIQAVLSDDALFLLWFWLSPPIFASCHVCHILLVHSGHRARFKRRRNRLTDLFSKRWVVKSHSEKNVACEEMSPHLQTHSTTVHPLMTAIYITHMQRIFPRKFCS